MEACSGFGVALQLSWDAEGSGARVQGPGWRVWSGWKMEVRFGAVLPGRGLFGTARQTVRYCTKVVLNQSYSMSVDPQSQNNPGPLNPKP